MKYLCLCYYDTTAFAALDPVELEAIGPACRPYDAALKATGKMMIQGSLSMPETWTTIVPEEGQPVVKAGPYLEGSQQAGAFFFVEAASNDEAIVAASKHAAANVGEKLGFAVEVRACDMFETF
jgi:hypothetical protein